MNISLLHSNIFSTCPLFCLCSHQNIGLHTGARANVVVREGRWPRGRVDVSELGGPGFDSLSRQPQVVAHQH